MTYLSVFFMLSYRSFCTETVAQKILQTKHGFVNMLLVAQKFIK